MKYFTHLVHLTEAQQERFKCRYIVRIKYMNPLTGYISPETRKKFNSLAEAVKYQRKFQ